MSKLISCKSCGKEIAKSAKACPHCGAKPKPGCLRIALAVFLVFIGIGLIGGALSGNDEPTKVPTESNAPVASIETTEAPANFTVGDTVTKKDVYVTLSDVREFDGEYLHPADGNVFVAFELEIENKSDSPLAISSLMCFEAYFDDYAANFSLGGQTESGKNQIDGEIAPGKKMKGAICYEVPADWATAELHFNPDLYGTDFVFVYSK